MLTKYHYSYPFAKWNIKSYNEALKLNIKFLKGKLLSSPYHCSPIYDMNTSKLIYIHKVGHIFTTNGQSSECIYDEYVPKTKHVYIHIESGGSEGIIESETISEEMVFSSEQKSYIDGYMPQKYLESFLKFLKTNSRKVGYFVYDINNNKTYDNKDTLKGSYWVTRECGYNDKDWKIISVSPFTPDLFPMYDHYFSKLKTPLVQFSIFDKKPCNKATMEDFLIKFINKNKSTKSKRKSKKVLKPRRFLKSRRISRISKGS